MKELLYKERFYADKFSVWYSRNQPLLQRRTPQRLQPYTVSGVHPVGFLQLCPEQQIHAPLHPCNFTIWQSGKFGRNIALSKGVAFLFLPAYHTSFHCSRQSIVLPLPAWTANGFSEIWMMASVKKAPPLQMHCIWPRQRGTKTRAATIFYPSFQMGNMIDIGHSNQLHPCYGCEGGLGLESEPAWHVELSWHVLHGDLPIWAAVGGENRNLPLTR